MVDSFNNCTVYTFTRGVNLIWLYIFHAWYKEKVYAECCCTQMYRSKKKDISGQKLKLLPFSFLFMPASKVIDLKKNKKT